jgi:threonine/homoserine/homoserine lactone efflux protein
MFLRGALIGFAIAAPVGPVGVLCIRRSLTDGRMYGFLSGLGAATADAVYGAIAAFGLIIISSFLVEQQIWLRMVGGLFLLYLGVKTYIAQVESVEIGRQSESLLGAYASTFVLTLTNPLTILSFAAIYSGLGMANQPGRSGAIIMVLGVFCGSAAWWLLLSLGAGLFSSRLSAKGMIWINRISGVTLFIFGLIALLSIFSA